VVLTAFLLDLFARLSANGNTELEADEQTLREYWFRRVKYVIGCRDRRGFSACLTGCLLDSKICDEGHKAANDR